MCLVVSRWKNMTANLFEIWHSKTCYRLNLPRKYLAEQVCLSKSKDKKYFQLTYPTLTLSIS